MIPAIGSSGTAIHLIYLVRRTIVVQLRYIEFLVPC